MDFLKVIDQFCSFFQGGYQLVDPWMCQKALFNGHKLPTAPSKEAQTPIPYLKLNPRSVAKLPFGTKNSANRTQFYFSDPIQGF